MSETPTAVTVCKTHSWHVYAVSRSGYWTVAGSLSRELARAEAKRLGLPLIPWSKAIRNTGLGCHFGTWPLEDT